MKNILAVLLLTLLIASCADNKKKKIKEDKDNENSSIEEVSEVKEENLKVIINAKVLIDDVFEVYFYEVGEETFHSKDFVSSRVTGKLENQDITFILPDRTYPERLRLDFGKNEAQKLILLNSIKITYNKREYLFENQEIATEFKASKFIDFDKEKFIIKTKPIDGRYDPYFYTKKVTNIVNYLLED